MAKKKNRSEELEDSLLGVGEDDKAWKGARNGVGDTLRAAGARMSGQSLEYEPIFRPRKARRTR